MTERPSILLQTGFNFCVEREDLPGNENTLWEAVVTVHGYRTREKGFTKRSEAFLWAEAQSYEMRALAASRAQ